MQRTFLLTVLALILLSASAVDVHAYGNERYGTGHYVHRSTWGPNPYYISTQYISPARTGLPSNAYYYPGSYPNTWQNFGQYRAYTHAAYRDYNRLAYAQPYTGPINPWYSRR